MDRRVLLVLACLLLMTASPMVSPTSAQTEEGVIILETVVNPANNHTYYLLSDSSWSDAADAARGLDGFLVTINDAEENDWLFDTFAIDGEQRRHLWTGLSDRAEEGQFRWHDGQPFLYRSWGADQPATSGDDEDHVHIAGTNMGDIEPGTWNDLEDDPQYFPVYGVVEVGEGADFALRFDGIDDYIIIDEDFPEITGHIEIEAWVNIPDSTGIQFITMFGDYGWGLYLNDGYLAYSNEYSMATNPTSNRTITENTWTHVKVVIDNDNENEYGGEFFIDNVSSGLIDLEDSHIPAGDFGSNDCYQSGDDCDELFIGRMGAGCDCNHLRGLLDDVIITTETGILSEWNFPEGEGWTTEDQTARLGAISGAAWVMPDGTIVAQAVELFNGEFAEPVSAEAGDTLLFFMKIPENTKYLSLEAYSGGLFDEDDSGQIPEIEIYFAVDRIPTKWDHDDSSENFYSYGFYSYGTWEWPTEGIWWMTIRSDKGYTDMNIHAYWEEAPQPPPLEELTQLNNGIAVTGQGASNQNGPTYYYVDVTENLSNLKVRTYGGNGQCDLGIAWKVLPDTNGGGWIDGVIGEPNGREQPTSDYSYNVGNDEQVNIFDAQIGIYYVAISSWRGCKEVTIIADFTFAPDNTIPEAAIELTAGVAYGPLSGYEGLDQWFYIDTPTDTERLEVDLDGGDGDATLFMRLESYPTWTAHDKHSAAPGASDSIKFNDPTPGRWYILLGSEESFSAVTITASFADRYVWEYDGEPIQLFNDEAVEGIIAPEGNELYFFIEIEDSATDIQIKTWGGEGNVLLDSDYEGGDDIIFGDGPGMGRQGSTGEDGSGPNQNLFWWFGEGRIDITLTAQSDIEDIGIIATWEEFDFPRPDPEPDPDPEDVVIITCDEMALKLFEEFDINKDGDISRDEAGEEGDIFEEIDLDGDGIVEIAEVKQEVCSCDNEFTGIWEQFESDRVSIELMSSVAWKNDFDLFAVDRNGDLFIDSNEVNRESLACSTTYDAFDRDGDGTPDAEDEFPDDPTESVDTDGDGVGDNSDIVASVSNDIVYGTAGILGIILISILGYMMVGQRNGHRSASTPWEDEKRMEQMQDSMLGIDDANNDNTIIPPVLDLGPVEVPPESVTVQDLFD